MKKYLIPVLSLVGLVDATYLSYKHFANVIPPCSTSIWADCGGVLTSQYAYIFGIPLAYIGLVHYSLVSIFAILIVYNYKRVYAYILVILSFIGLFASIYFVYLQLIPLRAICSYCMVSAIVSLVLFMLINKNLSKERKQLVIAKLKFMYKNFLKRYFFLMDPEFVHEKMTRMGEMIGKFKPARLLFEFMFVTEHPLLQQKIAGIDFKTPVGLAAGFDYQAQLTNTLDSVGFGFGTVGTITNLPYAGNPKPRLGRLPRSQSLMVNKGFKNKGVEAVAKKLNGISFGYPVGISIGRSNSSTLASVNSSIKDIVNAFKTVEHANLPFSYYELNISCPNLIHGNVSFYPTENLEKLLSAIENIKLSKPVFIKMPIEKSDNEVKGMLKVISKHSPKGVIFGNLQKDRNHPTLNRDEVENFNVGSYSGKPTYERSNELIAHTFKLYKKRLVIIGCGGIFSGQDAYEKIIRGASLVQLITGMIFEGPQLPAQINFELEDILGKNGYSHISEAVGSFHKLK